MATIYTNGKIYTQNAAKDCVDTVVVDNGRFVYVGKREGYDAAPADCLVDLQGACVLPGLIDSHQHLSFPATSNGPHANKLAVIMTDDIDDAIAQIKSFVEAHPDYEVYKIQAGLKDNWGRHLTKDDLDPICPDKPLMVHDSEAHAWTGNTKLFEKIGITKDTPDPSPGFSTYEHDSQGELTGYATEMTHFDAHRAVDTLPVEDMVDNLKKLVDYNLALGITGCYDAGNVGIKSDEEVFGAIKQLDDAGVLKQRIGISAIAHLPVLLSGMVDRHKKYQELYEGGNITVDTIKLFIDGTCHEFTGYVLEPYKKTGSCGGRIMNDDQLYDALAAANDAGFNVHIHCMGDAGMRMILDALERMDNAGIKRTTKTIITHCHLVHPDDMARIPALGVYLNLTPHWIGSLEGAPDPSYFWRAGYKNGQYRTMWDTGVNVAFACDMPGLPWLSEDSAALWNPFIGWQTGVTRLCVGDTDSTHVHLPEERMTIDQMIEGYTIRGARQMGWEDECGSIEVGKSADMVVLDQNPYEIPIEEVHAITPRQTFFKGELVYQSEHVPVEK